MKKQLQEEEEEMAKEKLLGSILAMEEERERGEYIICEALALLCLFLFFRGHDDTY